MRRLRCLAALAAVVLPLAEAAAQSEPFSANTLLTVASRAPDLVFPTEVSRLTSSSQAGMAIYKPEGPGPFPAIVLVHQCGGIRNARWQNESMVQWAREAVARGYVAFLIDTLGQRSVDTVCFGPKANVTFMRGARDALQAAAHLKRFDFVDKDRVGMAGYSWGAMVGVFLSSQLWGDALSTSGRFAAVVSFYPGCFLLTPQSGPAYEVARPDINKPLLVLMGDLDNETPPADCIQRLEPVKAAGMPVEWHLYPDTTHCWDCRNLDGLSKTDVRGNRVTYRYSDEVTKDLADRMFAFLERHMRAAGR